MFSLIIVLLFSSFGLSPAYGGPIENSRVFQLGIMGQGQLNLDKNLSRAELATIAVRLTNLESLVSSSNKTTKFKDVKGWSLAYVNIVSNNNLMSGSGKDTFNPNGKVNYTELLTVLMRILGYEDGIDFKEFPKDYYNKAMEIGLGNLYIPSNEVVTREVVVKTIDKALGLNIKGEDRDLASTLLTSPPQVVKPKDKPYMDNLSFNTSIIGVFSGRLKGISVDGYKVVLLSKAGNTLDSVVVNKEGTFSIEGFDVSTISRLQGYKYEVYSPNGELILNDNLN